MSHAAAPTSGSLRPLAPTSAQPAHIRAVSIYCSITIYRLFFIITIYSVLYKIKTIICKEASRGAAARGVTVNRLVVGSVPARGDEIFT